MTEAEIKEKIKSALCVVTGNKNLQVNDNTTLFQDMGLESIDFVDLIFEVEQLVGCQLDINELVQATYSSRGERYTQITFQQFFEFVRDKSHPS